MPNIRETNVGALDIRPTEVGVEATAAAARRGGAFFNQASGAMDALGHRIGSTVRDLGDVGVKYIDHQEISRGAQILTALQAQKTEEWNAIAKKADGRDPSVAPGFRDEILEPALEKFKQGFTTERSQQWAETHVDRFREHMFQHTTATMATKAGEVAKTDAMGTINNSVNMVFNDPSSLGLARDTLNSAFDGIVGSANLTAEQAAHVKTQLIEDGQKKIVKAAISGAIVKGGDWQKLANDPKNTPYIDQSEIQQFVRAEQGHQRLVKAEERSNRVMSDHIAKTEFHQAVNELEISTAPKNVGDKPTLPADYWQRIEKLSLMPGAAQEPGQLHRMINQGEIITDRLNKPEPLGRISHQTTQDLRTRLRATDESRLTSDAEIWQAYKEGKLNEADFNSLRKDYADMKTPQGEALNKDRAEFFKRYSRMIDAGITEAGMPTLLGSQKMYEAEAAAKRQEDDLRKRGLDPHLVYDPRSEYFFGKPENISRFRASLQENQEYEKTIKAQDKKRFENKNLTGPGKGVISTSVEDKPISLPPLDKRNANQVYPTAQGPMRWTGTGWVAP